MTIQFSVALRNAMLDQLETTIGTSAVVKIFTGSQPANCAAADSGTKLAEFDLASDWMSNASSGSKSFSSTPISTTAVAAGTAGYYRVYESTATTCHMQGSIGQGSGDLSLDNTNIANGQTVQITSWAINMSPEA